MVVSFTFSCGQELTEEQIDRLRKLIPDLQVDDKGQLRYYTEYVADLRRVYEIVPNVKLEVSGIRRHDISILLTDVVERLEAVAARAAAPGFNVDQEFNKRVNVHVPGLGLLLVDKVDVLTDACTQTL